MNAADVEGYARLVGIGRPDFIEIKGVTYCGNSDAKDKLSMANVPYHAEVKAFAEALAEACSGGGRNGKLWEGGDWAVVCQRKRRRLTGEGRVAANTLPRYSIAPR